MNTPLTYSRLAAKLLSRLDDADNNSTDEDDSYGKRLEIVLGVFEEVSDVVEEQFKVVKTKKSTQVEGVDKGIIG